MSIKIDRYQSADFRLYVWGIGFVAVVVFLILIFICIIYAIHVADRASLEARSVDFTVSCDRPRENEITTQA